MSSWYSVRTEANASEFLEYSEEMFPRYWASHDQMAQPYNNYLYQRVNKWEVKN